MLFIISWLVLHYLEDFIAFLHLSINLTLYKGYFNIFCKILSFSNNEKKKQCGQVVVFFEIEFNSFLIEAQLPANKLDKAKF